MNRQGRVVGFIISLPAWVALAFMFIVPICWSVYAAFCKFDVRMRQTWTGLDNLRAVLASAPMRQAIKTTLLFTVVTFTTILVTALLGGIAMASVRAGKRVRLLFQVAPMMASAANGSWWRWLFAARWGGMATRWMAMGRERLLGHSSPWAARLAVCIVLWAWLFPGAVYLVGVTAQGVPKELHEAAELDGANELQKFVYITLPTIRRPILYMALGSLAGLLQVYEAPWLLWRGGPLGATETVVMRMVSLKDGYGQASAVGLLLLIVATGLSYAAWSMMKKQ